MAENDSSSGTGNGTGIEILDRPAEKTKRPPMYVVFVHNDPYTPREFVVAVLMRFFQKTEEQAIKVMMTAHTKGMGAAGTYTKEIAETKAAVANSYCRAEGRPLHFSVQEE
jgi:ATP-dependent Clp protease adaptor protein ClpS